MLKLKKKKNKNKSICSTYNFATLNDEYHIHGKKIDESKSLRSMINKL